MTHRKDDTDELPNAITDLSHTRNTLFRAKGAAHFAQRRGNDLSQEYQSEGYSHGDDRVDAAMSVASRGDSLHDAIETIEALIQAFRHEVSRYKSALQEGDQQASSKARADVIEMGERIARFAQTVGRGGAINGAEDSEKTDVSVWVEKVRECEHREWEETPTDYKALMTYEEEYERVLLELRDFGKIADKTVQDAARTIESRKRMS